MITIARIIQILLIWWIASIIFRWIGRLNSPRKRNEPVERRDYSTNAPSRMPYTGEIEDADFEEIDDK